MSTGMDAENMRSPKAAPKEPAPGAQGAPPTANGVSEAGGDNEQSQGCFKGDKAPKAQDGSDRAAVGGKSPDKNTGVAVRNRASEALNSILAYDSDVSCSSGEEAEIMNFNWEQNRGEKRLGATPSTSSSSSSSQDDDEEDDNEEEEEEEEDDDESVVETTPPPQSKGAIKKDKTSKTDGELGLDELPPVPDLSTLSLDENEAFVHIGQIMGIVDKLVTVAAIPGPIKYDLDTPLFLEEGKKPLGFIFDVLGQVASPIYAVRFNSNEDIKNLQVRPGLKVYAAPRSKHTQVVPLRELYKIRGSDASWKDDNEVPPEFLDFSDDEAEYYFRSGAARVVTHVKRPHGGGGGTSNYKRFETTMNKRNVLNTKLNRYMDSYKQARDKARTQTAVTPQISAALPAAFDPSVPPPNMRTLYPTPPTGYLSYAAAAQYGQHAPPELSAGVNPPAVHLPPASVSGGDNNNMAAHHPHHHPHLAGIMPPSLFRNLFAQNNRINAAHAHYFHASNEHPAGPSQE